MHSGRDNVQYFIGFLLEEIFDNDGKDLRDGLSVEFICVHHVEMPDES